MMNHIISKTIWLVRNHTGHGFDARTSEGVILLHHKHKATLHYMLRTDPKITKAYSAIADIIPHDKRQPNRKVWHRG